MDSAIVTPVQADFEFAELLGSLADEAERDGDPEFACYFRDAAEWHWGAASENAKACGESDGTSTCVVRSGEHDPASNYIDGPVRHVAADGSAWTGPMSADEAATAREAAAL